MPSDAVANLLLRVRGDTSDGENKLRKLVGSLKEFSQADGEAEAKVETRKAASKLGELQRDLAEFSRDSAEAKADVDTTEARLHLEVLEAELESVNRKHVTAEADVQISKALLKIQLLRREMSATAHMGDGIDNNKIIREFGALSTVTRSIGRNLKGATGDSRGFFDKLNAGLKSARVNIGPFSLSLSSLGRIWLVMIPNTTALATGLFAIGASAGAAVIGLGALAIAAVGAGAAIATIGIGAIAAYVSSTKALEGYRNAMEALRNATRAQRDAERNLSEAQRSARKAQDDLKAARAEAAETIADDIEAALETQADAEMALISAQQAQQDAQEDLSRAREDAIRTLRDLRLAAEGAGTSEKRARLDLAEAQAELTKAEAQGITGLDLRDKRLDVEEAENALHSARVENTRAVKDLNEAERKGVSGSDGVVNALRAIDDANQNASSAQKDLVDATSDLADAQKKTVRQDQGVIAAKEQLRSSNRQVEDSQRALTAAVHKTEVAQKEANKQHRAAATVLSGVGLALRKTVAQFQRDVKKMLGPGINAIFKGTERGLRQNLSPLVLELRDAFTGLGEVIGNSIERITKAFADKRGETFFKAMIRGGKKIVPLLTKSFIALFRVFGNIARAAMPFLVEGLKSLAGTLRGFAKGTSDIKSLRDTIEGLVGHLKSTLKFFGAIGGAIGALGKAAAGPGQGLIDWMTEAINGWTEWANSTEGQEKIGEFIDEMIPLFKQLLGFVWELIKLFINVAKIMAPAAYISKKVFTEVLKVVNDLLGFVGDLPAPIRAILGLFLLFKGPLFLIKKLVGLFFSLGSILGGGSSLLTGLASFGRRILGIGAKIGSKFLPLLGKIGPSLLRIAGPAGFALAAALEWGDDLGKGIAGLAGYSDEAIAATERAAAAQGRLNDIYGDFNAKLRKLGKNLHKSMKLNPENLDEIFDRQQLFKLYDIMERGGNVAGKKWVQAEISQFRKGRGEIRNVLTQGYAATIGRSVVDVAGLFKEGGKSWAEALLGGFTSLKSQIVKGIKGVAQKMRDVFPGSEPKDASSPLRGLGEAGKAIVVNLSKGMLQAQNAAPKAIARNMAKDIGRAAPAGGRGNTTHSRTEINMPISAPNGGYPDADAMLAAAARNLRHRGLSLPV